MASQNQVQIFNYQFDHTAKTVTFLDYDKIELESVLVIRNQTTGAFIYKATDTAAFGGTVATNVLTFSAATVGMASTDKLLIFVGQKGLFKIKASSDNAIQKFNEYSDSYTDERGNLLTRSTISNLEDSFSTGTEIAELAFPLFTNNSKIVTGVAGYLFIRKGCYIVLNSTYYKIVKILSPDSIEIDTAWPGATNTYVCTVYPAKIFTTLAFGSSYFTNERISILFATAINGSKTGWLREVGFGQKTLEAKVALNTRDANSIVLFGFNRFADGNLSGNSSIKNTYCQFLFDGTDNKIIKTQTSSRLGFNEIVAADETYTIVLPNRWTTAQALFYRIEILDTEVNFYVSNETEPNDGYYLVSSHKKIIPDRDLKLSAFGLVYNNTGAASNVNIDFSRIKYNSYNTIATSINAKKDSVLAVQDGNTEIITVPIVFNAEVVIDMSQYSSLAVQFTGTWAGTWDFQQANDPTILWSARMHNISLNTIVTSTTANGIFTINTRCKYVRLNCSNNISGTAIIIVTKKASPAPELLSNVTLAGTNAVNATLVAGGSVTPVPLVASGTSTHHRRLSTADTNLVSVKTSAAVINNIEIFNTSAATKYLKFYNKASAPVIASDSALIVKTIAIPANDSVIIGGATFGIRFATGIAYAITAAVTDTDTTATAANEVIVNISYT